MCEYRRELDEWLYLECRKRFARNWRSRGVDGEYLVVVEICILVRVHCKRGSFGVVAVVHARQFVASLGMRIGATCRDNQVRLWRGRSSYRRTVVVCQIPGFT